MFLKPSEYLRELYSINVCLILDISLISLPSSNNPVFTFIFLLFSMRYKLFVSVLQWLACLFSLPVFFLRYNPAGLQHMSQLDYLNLWRYLNGKVWSFLSSCLRQKWKTTGWKDPLIMRFWDYSTIELLFISLSLWLVSEKQVLSTSFTHTGFYI